MFSLKYQNQNSTSSVSIPPLPRHTTFGAMRLLWLLLAGGWSSSWGFRAGPAVARPPARLSLALQAQSPSPPEGSDRDDATKARDGGSFLTALSDLAREAELKTSEWAEESERDRMARQLERTETRAAEAADRDQAGVDATEVRSAYNMEMLPPVGAVTRRPSLGQGRAREAEFCRS
eukprot:scaffold2926_cov247-Pinguiococcus_pyrenoidosus.AAC.11